MQIHVTAVLYFLEFTSPGRRNYICLLTFIAADNHRACSVSIYARCLEDAAIFPSLFRDCCFTPARQETDCLSSRTPPKRRRRGGQTGLAEPGARPPKSQSHREERRRGGLQGESYPGEQEGAAVAGGERAKPGGSGEQAEHAHRENVPQPTQPSLTKKLCTT